MRAFLYMQSKLLTALFKGKNPTQSWIMPTTGISSQQIMSGGLSMLEDVTDPHMLFKALDSLFAWCTRVYNPLGGLGTSRAAFDLGDKHAIKIALNKAGIAQNKVEAHISEKLLDLPLAHVRYIAKNNLFMVVDKAMPFNEPHFKEYFGISFKNFASIAHELCDYEGENGPEFKAVADRLYNSLPENARILIMNLAKHGVVACDLDKRNQWGDIDDHPVIIDYGLSYDVWNEHYTYGQKNTTSSDKTALEQPEPTGQVGEIYLLHFDRPLAHARHYLGWAKNAKARIRHHEKNTSQVAIIDALHKNGIGFEVARIWKNVDRNYERKLKNMHDLSRICPICKQLGIDRNKQKEPIIVDNELEKT